MKVRFHLPYDYPVFDPSKDYQENAPVFDISATDDNGNDIPELKRKIPFGPEFYDFITRKLPALSGHYGMPIPIGDVGAKPVLSTGTRLPKYAYFGYGPLNSLLNRTGRPYSPGTVNLMDFSDKDLPTGPNQKYLYMRPTADLISDDDRRKLFGGTTSSAEDRAKKKSDRLTNILRESMDFSPLFGGEVPYRDEEDEKAISDVWVPVKNPDGTWKVREDGSRVFMPVPQVRELPIYNMMHPMWQRNPQAAWDMLKGYDDTALDSEGIISRWNDWDEVPSYADMSGKIKRTSTGEPRKYNFAFENLKLADPQHHSKYMSAKEQIREALRDADVPFTDEDVEALLDKGTYGGGKGKTVLKYYYPALYDTLDTLSKVGGGSSAYNKLREIWKLADFDRRNFDKNQATQAKMLEDYQTDADKEKSLDSIKKRVAALRSEGRQYDIARAKKDLGGVDIRSPKEIRKFGREHLKSQRKAGNITPEQFDELDKYWFASDPRSETPTLFQTRNIYKEPTGKMLGEMLRQMAADKQKDTQNNIVAGLSEGASML